MGDDAFLSVVELEVGEFGDAQAFGQVFVFSDVHFDEGHVWISLGQLQDFGEQGTTPVAPWREVLDDDEFALACCSVVRPTQEMCEFIQSTNVFHVRSSVVFPPARALARLRHVRLMFGSPGFGLFPPSHGVRMSTFHRTSKARGGRHAVFLRSIGTVRAKHVRVSLRHDVLHDGDEWRSWCFRGKKGGH